VCAKRHSWRATDLGTARDLDQIVSFEAGAGPPIVFVHGLLVNANLWRKVVAELSPSFRCIALDLPLGSHVRAMPAGADLSPPALANLIADAIEELDLEDVTLVGNDTGGALSQLVATRRPERIGRLVLTSCDYRDNFPPAAFRPLIAAARAPGALRAILTTLRPRTPRRLPLAYGWLAKRPIDPDAEDSYVLAALADPGVMADLRRVLVGIDTRHTNAAADALVRFERPALIAWSRADRFFPPRDAQALAATLPDARLEWIDDSYTFSPEDQPGRLAALIAGFAGG
jgi:pimeloyl-ACP methyl ester carboxylesterase